MGTGGEADDAGRNGKLNGPAFLDAVRRHRVRTRFPAWFGSPNSNGKGWTERDAFANI
jgi:hypothetical protein